MGWIGPTKCIYEALSAADADTDEGGKYLVSGGRVCTGIGGEEAVVDDGVTFYVNGEPHLLVQRLCRSTAGMLVTEI